MNCGTKQAPLPTVDMWDTDGPGYGLNGSWACNQTAQAGCTYQVRASEGRRRRRAACTERAWLPSPQDDVFVARVESVISAHDPASGPLFLFWAPHAPHDPYEAPQAYLDKPVFANITQPERQYYSSMVNLLDDNVGRVVAALKAAGLWNSTLLAALMSDGPGAFAAWESDIRRRRNTPSFYEDIAASLQLVRDAVRHCRLVPEPTLDTLVFIPILCRFTECVVGSAGNSADTL
jgi:hypothetical protein